MAKYYIEGGRRLAGEITVHGAKNAVLPILAASLLTKRSVLHNCPTLADTASAIRILEHLGSRVESRDGSVAITTGGRVNHSIPDGLMREMRSSVVFLGAIIARAGEARISMPGGCELGPRPIDLHLSALEKLGVDITENHGYLECRVKGRMRGASITLPFPSVGATENILLAACTAEGETIIRNAAREPEITDLANFLRGAGAKIDITGGGTVHIHGVSALDEVEYSVIPDRIAAATYLCCAAITGGEVLLRSVVPEHLAAILPILEEAGCAVRQQPGTIYLKAPQRPGPVRLVRTMPYPGFPTDAQSPLMALCCVSSGTSVFVETIFENRYKHVGELARMGARVSVEGRIAVVEGARSLHGAPVVCTDLRGGAALVTAALAAQGRSEIDDIYHIERGYQDFDKNLASLGAIMEVVG